MENCPAPHSRHAVTFSGSFFPRFVHAGNGPRSLVLTLVPSFVPALANFTAAARYSNPKMQSEPSGDGRREGGREEGNGRKVKRKPRSVPLPLCVHPPISFSHSLRATTKRENWGSEAREQQNMKRSASQRGQQPTLSKACPRLDTPKVKTTLEEIWSPQ